MLIRSPVICDRCRASGKAGDPGFTAAGARPLDFTPVPGRRRHDGWTAARQRGFIDTLADTGSVRHSANAVNMTPESAYALRRRPGAAEFCAAWNAALDHGIDRLVSVTMERAIHGVAVPVFWQGKQVGERRIYNDRLAMFHLRHRLPDRYGTLESPARGTRSAQTRARAEQEAAEAEEEHKEIQHQAVYEHWRSRVTRMHESWRRSLASDPAKAAAYDLIFGPEESEFRGNGPANRIIRFPPEIAMALFDLVYPDPEALQAAGRVLPGREHLLFASARAGLMAPAAAEEEQEE